MTTQNDPFVAEVRQYMGRMDGALSTIADAMVKIARLEERHQETRESLGRAFDRLESVEKRQADDAVVVERIQGRLKPLEEARGWMVTGMIAVVGLVGMAVVGLVLVVR